MIYDRQIEEVIIAQPIYRIPNAFNILRIQVCQQNIANT